MPLRERLGSLVPDAVKRRRTDDDAFVEAAREAYRAAAKEAARYLGDGDQAQGHADSPPAAPTEPADAPLTEARAPGTEPAAPPWSWTAERPAQTDPRPPPNAPASPSASGARATATRPPNGGAPLDHLLRVPESVDVAADDFFAGLTRRVEGDR